jgi:branched-subunit amino acid transport protein
MEQDIVLLILGMAGVTFFSRFLPMILLSRWTLPEKVKWGLEDIPVAVLSAIVFPILFFDRKGVLTIQPQFVLAAIPVFIFAWKVKSIWGSVVLGMLIFWGLGFLL